MNVETKLYCSTIFVEVVEESLDMINTSVKSKWKYMDKKCTHSFKICTITSLITITKQATSISAKWATANPPPSFYKQYSLSHWHLQVEKMWLPRVNCAPLFIWEIWEIDVMERWSMMYHFHTFITKWWRWRRWTCLLVGGGAFQHIYVAEIRDCAFTQSCMAYPAY